MFGIEDISNKEMILPDGCTSYSLEFAVSDYARIFCHFPNRIEERYLIERDGKCYASNIIGIEKLIACAPNFHVIGRKHRCNS